MKRLISILVLLVVMFFTFQYLINFFNKEFIKKYKIVNGEKEFNIIEKYSEDNNEVYSIIVNEGSNSFSYLIDNNFKKQKKIIKEIEYIQEDRNICIYPILIDGNGTYIECIKDNNIYTSFSYPDNDFISEFKNVLLAKGYTFNYENDLETKNVFDNSTVYTNNIPSNDNILLWAYKGIDILNEDGNNHMYVLGFDKYENKLGCMVNKYYIIPNYENSKVLEFSSLSIIDLDSLTVKKIDLGYTLSSSTYLNGTVNNKIYYTDPSNLIQIEINPKKENVRLIGNTEIPAQMYDGTWKDVNIYDFRSREILFKNTSIIKNDSYIDIKKGNNCYYYYQDNGNVYQVLEDNLDNKVLLFNANNLKNFNIVGNDIYYSVNNTLYLFNYYNGITQVLENNDLIYNANNRISVYRKG